MTKLKVGTRVKTRHDPEDSEVVRTITAIEKDNTYGSGYWASADAGEPCPTCGRPFARKISRVDSTWFKPIEEVK